MHLVPVVLLTAAAGQQSVSPDALVTLGESLAQRGDGKKAIVHLNKVLADTGISDPLRARAAKAMGLALLQERRAKDAVLHLQNATTLLRTDEKAWLLLGLAHDGAAQYHDAIEAYRRGVQELPMSSALKHELGMALLETGKPSEAAVMLVAAGQLAPRDADIRMDAAYALTVSGRFAEAKVQAEEAVELAPESANALYTLGAAEAGLGQRADARHALTRALEIDDMHVPSLVQLGWLELTDTKDTIASKHFLRALQVEPDNARARTGLGIALGRLGTDDVKAETLLRDTLRVDPKNAQALALLGDVAARAGRLEEAIRHLELLKKLRPDDARVSERLAELKREASQAKSSSRKAAGR